MRQTVWVWQVIVVLAWLAVRWLLLRGGGGPGRRVDTLWTANPLVFGVGVLGAHLDLVAAALALAALVLAARSPLVAGVLAGLAVSTKVTYGVVGVAVLLGWLERDRARLLRRGAVHPLAAAASSCRCTCGRARTSSTSSAGRGGRSRWPRPWRLLVERSAGRCRPATVAQPGLRGRGRALSPCSSVCSPG